MQNLDFIARLFIFIGWLYIFFKAGPEFVKDVKQMIIEIKSSAEGKSAKQVKKKHSNYNISEFQNIHNLDRWR